MNVRSLGGATAVTGSRILGLGTFRPSLSVGNDAVAERIDSSDDWIRRRSGIAARRVAEKETLAGMSVRAAEAALADAGMDASEVGLVVLATMSYTDVAPVAAAHVAELLGARNAAAMDLGVACAGFTHALATADAIVRAGGASHVLVVGSEQMSDIVDPGDRGTAFLFGDGAGAVVVGPAESRGIGPVVWGADGDGRDLIRFNHARKEAAAALRISGPEVFRWACHIAPEVAAGAMRAAGVTVADLAAFVPDQANALITAAAVQALDLPGHVAVADDIAVSGNTAAASVPLALAALREQGRVTSGDLALVVGFGAGLAYAGQVVMLP